MKSFRIFNRQTGSIIALVALVLAVVAPTIASAAQLTARSVELSNSSKSSTNVSYNIKFTSVGAAGSAIIEFCSNSPLINATCDVPAGFTSASVGATAGSFTAATVASRTNAVEVTGSIAAATAISVPLSGITNPSTVGPLYARIVTYTGTDSTNYVDADTLGAGTVDEGGAAISITDTIGVSAAVMESMTFCVSAAAISKDCTGVTTPSLKLGEVVTTGVTALSASAVSTGNLFTQISTNAATGAVVSLKSNALDCGGLIRAGAASSVCDIKPVLLADTSSFVAGQAKFGVKTEAATDSAGATVSGTFAPVGLSNYNTTTFLMNYVPGNLTGVTSPYGDAFLDTAGAPVNNKNVKLTFGASISNSTPAGLYSVDLGMIATGKF